MVTQAPVDSARLVLVQPTLQLQLAVVHILMALATI
jgi:hypothetical protein